MSESDTRTTAARQFVALNGRVLAYRELPGTGTPVLLIHGIGSSGDTWGDIPERLSAQGVAVVAVDLPGHGESSRGPGDYSLGSTASTLRDLLDHLGIERVHLVGHSLGGGLAGVVGAISGDQAIIFDAMPYAALATGRTIASCPTVCGRCARVIRSCCATRMRCGRGSMCSSRCAGI